MAGVTLKIDTGGNDGVAHVFLVLTGPGGTSSSAVEVTTAYRLSPASGSSAAPSVSPISAFLEGTATHDFISLSIDQFNALKNQVTAATPPAVNTSLTRIGQEADWAIKVLIDAGILSSPPASPFATDFLTALNVAVLRSPYQQGLAVASQGLFTKGLPAPQPADVVVVQPFGSGGTLTVEGISESTLRFFDFDGDGIREAVGWPTNGAFLWVEKTDGSDSIVTHAGELAGRWLNLPALADGATDRGPRDGFTALSSLDANKNGTITSAESIGYAFRLWRDVDGDAAWDTAEGPTWLAVSTEDGKSLTAADRVGSLDIVSPRPSPLALAGGNLQTHVASLEFNLVNAGGAAVGTVQQMASSIQLVRNPSISLFTAPVTVTSSAASGPQIEGSGWVRDFREALSLIDGQGAIHPAATELAAALSAFIQSTSRVDQRGALLDNVLLAWARTSPRMVNSTDIATLNTEWGLRTPGNLPADTTAQGARLVLLPAGLTTTSSSSGDVVTTTDGQRLLEKMHALEVFNGVRFIQITSDDGKVKGNFQLPAPDAGTGEGTAVDAIYTLSLSASQVTQIQSAWEAAAQKALSALILQTTLRPYLDQIRVEISQNGLAFNTDDLDALLTGELAANHAKAIGDLVDLLRYAGHILQDASYRDQAATTLTGWLADHASESAVAERLSALKALNGASPDVTTGDDVLVGASGRDAMAGRAGDDILVGLAGDDLLNGDAGHDILAPGPGNDWMRGGPGNDTYVWGHGQGSDRISENDSTLVVSDPGTDRILIKGLAPADLRLYRPSVNSQDLVIQHLATGATLTIEKGLETASKSGMRVEQLVFDDGTVWDWSRMVREAVAGSPGADVIYGNPTADAIDAGAGDDLAFGNGGDDSILGGDGIDRLQGDGGADTLDGGTGNDWLRGGAGDDTYRWGPGQGNDRISESATAAGSGINDRIILQGLTLDQIRMSRTALGDWIITITASGETLTVERGLVASSLAARVEYLDFLDASGNLTQRLSLDQIWGLVVQGSDASETIYGNEIGDVIQALAGDDRVYGRAGNDQISGGAGRDVLYGEAGDDLLDGGAGDDWMRGGDGADTYFWGQEGGNDRISDGALASSSTSPDQIRLTNLHPDEITLSREGANHLKIQIRATGESLVIENQLSDSLRGMHIESLVFADGITPWDMARMRAEILQSTSGADLIYGFGTADTIGGQEGDDVLYGRGGDDTIDGGEGSDTLLGEAGSDTLSGGPGDDFLRGGAGSDTYRWGAGEGDDRISDSISTINPGSSDKVVFTGLARADVKFIAGENGGLVIQHTSNATLTIERGLTVGREYAWVEQFQFTDRTLSISEVRAEVSVAGQAQAPQLALVGVDVSGDWMGPATSLA